jgi:hypothetical protein
MATIALPLDDPEGHVVLAALRLYEALMSNCREVGGDAADVADVMAPIADRVTKRLQLVMYPEPPEPVWLHETTDDFGGDWYIYPAGVGR